MSSTDLGSLVQAAGRLLAEAGVPSPEHDARALAAHVLGVSHIHTLASVPPSFTARYADLVERRRGREPLQHIVGTTAFRHVRLQVVRGVFVPRPETELVAQVAIDEARRLADHGGAPVVVDLCCGAGGIAISVAVEVPGASVTAVDLSAEAVALTVVNATACGVELRTEVVDATARDALADLTGLVDVVAANPPYIPPDAVPLEPEVRDHDPDLALYGGGADGLEVPRGVVASAARLLRDGGLLVMEHGESQGAAVRAIVADWGFAEARTLPDLTGRPRMVVARRRLRAPRSGPA
jgi:release factor glutamine methyltransferase